MKHKFLEYAKYYISHYGLSVAMLLGVVLTIGSLVTFNPQDVSIFYHTRYGICQNMFGYVGASIAALLVYLLGSASYVFAGLLLYALVRIILFSSIEQDADRLVGLFGLTVVSSVLCHLYRVGFCEFSSFGGLIGQGVTTMLHYFDLQAKLFIAYGMLFISLVLVMRYFHLPVARLFVNATNSIIDYCLQVDHMPARMIRFVARIIAEGCFMLKRLFEKLTSTLSGKEALKESSIVEFERDEPVDRHVDDLMQDLFAQEHEPEATVEQKRDERYAQRVMPKQSSSTVKEVIEEESSVKSSSYALPNVDEMLSQGPAITTNVNVDIDAAALEEQSVILEEKLAIFGVKGKVVRVHPGPVITLFEYRPDNNIKLSKILGLEDDLAMALQALNIRILAPIPGKDVVGFEVANKDRKPVLLSDLFHSSAWTHFKGNLPLILGENTQGDHLVLDLASMPHLLIAGSTGSGKSVALNCMLISLLCAKNPDEVKLIIIDPKQLEFSGYEDIAHLLFPIVTDSKKAVPVLKWLVSTMEDRYELMSAHGVKNIFEYQSLAKNRDDLDDMPFIVLIIDELADLMMTTGKDIEDLIARIAQMSRAAGIHMIVATQRPSVDVITGLIKVNFPNRISFKVTSKVDSRTILDVVGAERLLGKGDMLFIDSKDPEIKRAHGAYVSNHEVNFLVNHIKSQKKVEYLDISEFLTSDKSNALLDSDQDLYREVIDMLEDHDEVSISMIQRKFRIGYNRSARIMETLEADGLILPSDGSKMRRVVKDS